MLNPRFIPQSLFYTQSTMHNPLSKVRNSRSAALVLYYWKPFFVGKFDLHWAIFIKMLRLIVCEVYFQSLLILKPNKYTSALNCWPYQGKTKVLFQWSLCWGNQRRKINWSKLDETQLSKDFKSCSVLAEKKLDVPRTIALCPPGNQLFVMCG